MNPIVFFAVVYFFTVFIRCPGEDRISLMERKAGRQVGESSEFAAAGNRKERDARVKDR